MAPPYRANPLLRSAWLQRGVALVAVVALAGTGIGVGYLSLAGPSGGRPLQGTATYLAEECSYDDDRGAVRAPVVLDSVNDGAVVYRVSVDVTRARDGDVAASEQVSVSTPDGRARTEVEVYVDMDRSRWADGGYRDCVLDLGF